MIANDIYTELSNYFDLTFLVDQRIYRRRLPRGVTYPAVSFLSISDNPLMHFQGEGDEANEIWQFDVWSTEALVGDNVMEQLIAAIYAATTFSAIRLTASDEQYDTNEGIYHRTVDFSLWTGPSAGGK